jgi:hypothetical protein
MMGDFKPVTGADDVRNLAIGDRVRFTGGDSSRSFGTVDATVVGKSMPLNSANHYVEFRRDGEKPGVPKQWRVRESTYTDPTFYTPDGEMRYGDLLLGSGEKDRKKY